MLRHITGFHRDGEGDWVAELDCLPHPARPPQAAVPGAPWVLTEAGRAEHVGTKLDCPLCDRAELPEGLVVARTAGPFDETNLAAGLRCAHRVPAGTWGCLRVLEGSVDFRIGTDVAVEHHLAAGQTQCGPLQHSP